MDTGCFIHTFPTAEIAAKLGITDLAECLECHIHIEWYAERIATV